MFDAKGQVELSGRLIQGPWPTDLEDQSFRVRSARGISPTAALHQALIQLEASDASEQTKATMGRLWYRFIRYAEDGRNISGVAAIDDDIASGFVGARNLAGERPAETTMHHRRSAIRLLFRYWREAGLVDSDPTIDLVLPKREYQATRPLTDAEIESCRSAALSTPTATRQPAAWALAEAGAHTSEIPFVTGSDLHLDIGCAWVRGSAKTKARFIPPTDWGVVQLRRRAESLADKDTCLAYEGSGEPGSAQASVSSAIGEVLARAGLGGRQGVTPRSVTAWVGVKVFEETGRTDEVAKRLGLRSLDRAAALISWRWDPDGE